MNQLFRPPQSQGRNPQNSWNIFKFLQLKTAQHVGLTMRWKPTKSAARGCGRRWRGFHPDAPRCCHLPEVTSTDWGPLYRWSDKLWGSSARPERTGFCWWAIWWIPAETCDYFVMSQLCGQFSWVKMILISNVFTSFDSPWNALSINFWGQLDQMNSLAANERGSHEVRWSTPATPCQFSPICGEPFSPIISDPKNNL